MWNSPARTTNGSLRRPSYGDFLRFSQDILSGGYDRRRLKDLYDTLGGNFKGLELFAAAKFLGADPEAFLRRLADVKDDLRAYMAVEETVPWLKPEPRDLLNRMRAMGWGFGRSWLNDSLD